MEDQQGLGVPGSSCGTMAPLDFERLFDAAPGLNLVVAPDDPTFTIVAANQAFLQATGTSRETIMGRPLFEVFPERPGSEGAARRLEVTASLRAALWYKRPEALAVVRYDVRPHGLEGEAFEERYWSLQVTPVVDANGDTAYLILGVNDVTDLMRLELAGRTGAAAVRRLKRQNSMYRECAVIAARAEQEASEGRSRLHQLLLRLPIGVAVLQGPDFVFEFVNPAYQAITGHPDPGEVLQRPLRDVMRPYIRDLYERVATQVYTTGHPFVAYEMPVTSYMRGAPEERYFNVLMQRLDHLGEVDRLMLVVEEVTAEIRATAALREANATLEERVRERTAQLIAVNRELDAFTYSVAHDLRAPLRAIHGFAQALVEDYGSVLPEGAQRYLQRIQANADRMASLIDDLLSLARVGHAQVQRRPLDLSALADEIMHRLLEAEPGRSVQWRVEPGLVAQADEGLLRVVLENLLSNALKFSSRRDIAEIAFGVTDHQGQRAFYVCDNGAGFDMAYADRLFEPFQRLHRDDEFPGTGIGLPTVRRAVARHGGHVWAEGSPDAGATVYFTLPEGGADLLARPGGESDLPGGVPAQ